jgi:hypothetical protein
MQGSLKESEEKNQPTADCKSQQLAILIDKVGIDILFIRAYQVMTPASP